MVEFPLERLIEFLSTSNATPHSIVCNTIACGSLPVNSFAIMDWFPSRDLVRAFI